ncbi:hypothetical protein TWF694_001865 [Orbilia ellipsospora]|uniref:Uncharacterized protein n=1 Tax=Orbilia ellipsospora TaxID=2528407 RepID=A0AAV9X3T1_9PEZI
MLHDYDRVAIGIAKIVSIAMAMADVSFICIALVATNTTQLLASNTIPYSTSSSSNKGKERKDNKMNRCDAMQYAMYTARSHPAKTVMNPKKKKRILQDAVSS